ncbi:hypothetical protein C0J52_23776, partial [Blattella germanica]
MTEKGIRYIENRELQPGIWCSCSITPCENNSFVCLILNLNENSCILKNIPQLSLPPTKYSINAINVDQITNKRDRHTLLDEKLRFEHINEGEVGIRSLCHQFLDIFKLPGDHLSTVRGVHHTIPTPSIPEGRAITLKYYRIPQVHQVEVEHQIQDMLNSGIITPSSSPFNFPLIVVLKKIDTSGNR